MEEKTILISRIDNDWLEEVKMTLVHFFPDSTMIAYMAIHSFFVILEQLFCLFVSWLKHLFCLHDHSLLIFCTLHFIHPAEEHDFRSAISFYLFRHISYTCSVSVFELWILFFCTFALNSYDFIWSQISSGSYILVTVKFPQGFETLGCSIFFLINSQQVKS